MLAPAAQLELAPQALMESLLASPIQRGLSRWLVPGLSASHVPCTDGGGRAGGSRSLRRGDGSAAAADLHAATRFADPVPGIWMIPGASLSGRRGRQGCNELP